MQASYFLNENELVVMNFISDKLDFNIFSKYRSTIENCWMVKLISLVLTVQCSKISSYLK